MNYLLNNIQSWTYNGFAGNHLMGIHGSGDATEGSAVGDLTGDDDVGVLIPELWSTSIFRYFEKALVFTPFFDDYSSLVRGKGDIVNLPEIQEVGTATKAAGEQVSYATNTETSLQLNIDQHKYSAKLFEDIAVVQAAEPLFAKYAQSMGYALAKLVDTSIETALQTLNTASQLDANNTMSNAKAEEAYATILELDIDPAECAWFVNPTMYADIVSNSGWVQSFGYTASGGATETRGFTGGAQSGVAGTLYGMPVYNTPLISSDAGTGTEAGYLVHKSAIAFAMQQDIRVQSDYSIDNLATRVVADVIYGVKLTDHANFKKGVRFTQAS